MAIRPRNGTADVTVTRTSRSSSGPPAADRARGAGFGTLIGLGAGAPAGLVSSSYKPRLVLLGWIECGNDDAFSHWFIGIGRGVRF